MRGEAGEGRRGWRRTLAPPLIPAFSPRAGRRGARAAESARSPRSHQPDRPRIFGDDRIARDQREPLDRRLRHQHPVEWVLVNEREAGQGDRMGAGHHDLAVAVVEQAPAKQADLNLKAGAPEPRLDRDLPQAHGAEHEIVVQVLDQRPRRVRKSFRLDRAPNQKVRVEEQLHSSPLNSASISSCAIVSKSSGTVNAPRMKPRRLGAAGASIGTTLTSGLPALAMMNGSPFAAASTSRDSCVLASWILTVFIKLSPSALVHR